MQALIPYVAGPAGAVVVLLLVLYAMHQFLDKRVWPAIDKGIERHLGQIDKMITQHHDDMSLIRDEMKAGRETVEKLHDRIEELPCNRAVAK